MALEIGVHLRIAGHGGCCFTNQRGVPLGLAAVLSMQLCNECRHSGSRRVLLSRGKGVQAALHLEFATASTQNRT